MDQSEHKKESNKEVVDRILKFIEENPDKINEYFDEQDRKSKVSESQVDRFWYGHRSEIGDFIYKVVDKYSKEEYKKRWYGRGYEPQEALYYFLYDVAAKYGREFTEDEYKVYDGSLMFTDRIYVLSGWTIELIMGQGSAIIIRPYNPPQTLVDAVLRQRFSLNPEMDKVNVHTPEGKVTTYYPIDKFDQEVPSLARSFWYWLFGK